LRWLITALAVVMAAVPANAAARSLRTPLMPADRYGELLSDQEPVGDVVVRVPSGRAAVTPLGIRWIGRRPAGVPHDCDPVVAAEGEALTGPVRFHRGDVKPGSIHTATTSVLVEGAGLAAPQRVRGERTFARATAPRALVGFVHVHLPAALLPLYPRRDLYLVAIDLSGLETSVNCPERVDRIGEAGVRKVLRGVRIQLPATYAPPAPDEAPPTTNMTDGSGLQLIGQNREEAAGQTVAAAGDVNADGYQDAIVSAPYAAVGHRGSAYVLFGHPGGGLAKLGDPALPGFRIDGPRRGTWTLPAVGVGDLDGDGLGDIAVGAPADDGPRDGGGVYIVRGKTDGAAVELASRDDVLFRIAGSRPCPAPIGGESVGQAVAAAGDANGDGIGDIAILAPGNCGEGSPTGSVYVVYGKRGPGDVDLRHLGRAGIAARGTWVGNSTIAGAGDVNGDGLADVVVGNVGYDVPAYAAIVPGRRDGGTTNLARPPIRITSETCSALSGVGAAGDVNGDGIGDIAIGNPESCDDGAPRAFVVFGKPGMGAVDLDFLGTGGYAIAGTSKFVAGQALADAGDVNGDGIPDLALGDGDANSVIVVYGKRDSAPIRLRSLGPGGHRWRASGGFGSSLAGLGDFDGDGRPDLLAGMPERAGYAGGAWILPQP
jgi:hypothetical protein